METYKIVYIPKIMNNGARGVALVEATSQQHALNQFQRDYAGEFHTVESCRKLLG
jgi:hypothetical protein